MTGTAVSAVKVVGMRAGGRETIVSVVDTGDPALLIPEPDNPHDPNAVAVWVAPTIILAAPDELQSSARDPDGVGRVAPDDRSKFQQAGYIPRDIAAGLDLPPFGIVGWVCHVRWAPPEYGPDGQRAYRRVAGFDVAARWERP